MTLVVRSSATLTNIEAHNLLACFPYEACSAAAESRQAASIGQALSVGVDRLVHELQLRRGDGIYGAPRIVVLVVGWHPRGQDTG